MTYSKELYEHVKKCADLKHEYTEVPTQFIHILLDEIDRLNTENFRLTSANKWVSVSERLPEVEEYYLTVHELQGEVSIHPFSKFGNKKRGHAVEPNTFYSTDHWDYENSINVTHWQPLPTPPTGGENGK